MIYNHVLKIFDMKLIVFDVKNNYCEKGSTNSLHPKKTFVLLIFFSGSAKSNRIGISTIPGSPQEKCEPIFPLSTNPSSDLIEKGVDEQENLVNSDDEDEQVPMPTDDVQTECNTMKECLFSFSRFVSS